MAATASPEYRKDPAVRAAVEQKLKTSDAAEIRRRWGVLADLAGRPWLHTPSSRNTTQGWMYPRWAVEGAVMEFSIAWCREGKCDVMNAVMVHNPEASSSWSFSNLLLQPAFDVLWDNSRYDGLGLVLDGAVKINAYNLQFVAEPLEARVNGVPYKPASVDQIASLGYAPKGAAPAGVAKAHEPEKAKTPDAAETRRRWGVFADITDKVWMNERGENRAWFQLRWKVEGAELDYTLGWCQKTKCTIRKAVLAYNAEPAKAGFSLESLFSNPLGALTGNQGGFEVRWEGESAGTGVVLEDGVRMDNYEYRYDASAGEVNVSGATYKPTTPSELARLTGHVLPGAPAATEPAAVAAKVGEPAEAAKPAAPVLAPVVTKGTVRGGSLGAVVQGKDSARPLEAPVIQGVQPGGPAAGAGLAIGDEIQRIGDIERPGLGDVLRTILSAPDKVVPIVVSRNGQSIARSVKLGERTLAGPCFVLGLADYQYDGECKDGFAHGRGELSYPIQLDGKPGLARYSGEFSRGFMEGRGRLINPRLTYEGEFLGHRRHGHGRMTFADGRPGFEGPFVHDKAVGLKEVGEAVVVCTRPDASGKFECDTPQRVGLAGGPGMKGRPDSPQALLTSLAEVCPSQRRLPSRTHLVWACGFGATSAPGAIDRGSRVEMRGRGTYLCLEREPGCKRTDPI